MATPRQVALALLLVLAGLGLRYAVWEVTHPIRSAGDAASGFRWGRTARQEGLVALYDRLERETRRNPGRKYEGMDYMPGRLAVMAAWAGWAEWQYPGTDRRRDAYFFNLPPLSVNALAELVAAFLVAGLVRQAGGTPRMALLSGALAWFHPTALVLGHGRPQWDTWLLPFFLGAGLLALRGRWLSSGLLVALGTMFKAQILFAAPVLPLVALVERRFRGAALWVAGFVGGMLACLSPWVLHGSLAPVRVALVGGANKWPTFPPPYVRNLCTLTSDAFGWNASTRLLGFVPAEALFAAAGLATVLGAAFLAARLRGIERVLALVMPWFGFYLLMPRVHLRYVVWPAVLVSVVAAFGRGYLAAWAVLAAVSTTSLLGPLVGQPKSPFPRLASLTEMVSPAEVWLILACAAYFLAKMLTRLEDAPAGRASSRT